MSGISQTIQSFTGGISEQPDYMKPSGSVKDAVNVVPDLTYGLYKRLGAKRVATNPLTISSENCKWFHYYRSASEGSYFGQIDKDGDVKMWRCSDGDACSIVWQTEDQYGDPIGATDSDEDAETAIKDYLKNQAGPNEQEKNIKTITINDTTFVSNQGVRCNLEDQLSSSRIHPYYAFVELKKTENGRQYALDISTPHSTPQNYWSATRLKVIRTGPSSADPGTENQGHCPHIGTRVVTAPTPDADYSFSGVNAAITGRELIFRLTVTGAQQMSTNVDDGKGGDYSCTYTHKIDLLHGGYGWISPAKQYTNSTLLTEFKGDDNSSGYTLMGAQYTIQIVESEKYRAPVAKKAGNVFAMTNLPHGFVRPAPTPFDADTASSAGAILGGIERHMDQSAFNSTWDEGGDSIKQINVTNGGSGYTTPPTVVVNNSGAGGVGLEAYATLKDGKVRSVTVSNPGWDYTSVPAISFSGGGGSSASATAVLTDVTTYQPIKADIIGNGIYMYSDTPFTVKVVENDLMRVVTDNTNDVSNLPNQCKHGYLIKVTNSQDTRADDYWLKFQAFNGIDGPGQWIESIHPDMRYRPDGATLPHIIQRTAEKEFTIDEFDWVDRTVGDNETNPRPYFITQPSNGQTLRHIHRVLYWRNRLVLANDSMIDLSAPNDLGNMWRKTALTTGPNDAIHIKSTQNYPASLIQGIETTTGLVLITENEQFLLYSADGVVTPESLIVVPLSSYFTNKNLEPVSLGTTIGFIDNSGRNSRFMEMANITADQEPTVFEHSKAVPTMLPKELDIIDISRDNGMIFFGKTGTDTVYIYRWFQHAEKRYLSSWVKWKFNRPIKYFFVTDDTFYFLDEDKFLQKVNLISGGEDATVTQDDIDWNVHLDNWVEVDQDGGYDPPSNKTTFPASWLSSVNNVTAKLVIVDPVNGNYDECEIDGTNIIAPGNWSKQVDSVTITNGGSGYTSAPTVTFTGGSGNATHQAQATATITDGVVTAINITDPGYNYTSAPTISFGSGSAQASAVVSATRYIGYLYDMEVDFPTIYPTKPVQTPTGPGALADVNSSLVIHRLNVGFGRVGCYEFQLNRTGKDTYNETYTSTPADTYEAGDVPYLLEEVKTIPVYDKNTNVTFKLKSSNPSPATLRSLSWEGDYTPKNYQRR